MGLLRSSVGWVEQGDTHAVVGGWLRFAPAFNRRLCVVCDNGSAFYGGSLLAVAPKVTTDSPGANRDSFSWPEGRRPWMAFAKGLAPCIRVSLRSTPLVPSLFQGPAYKGRPWPFTPLAASMRLAPLHNDSARPADGAVGVVCEIAD